MIEMKRPIHAVMALALPCAVAAGAPAAQAEHERRHLLLFPALGLAVDGEGRSLPLSDVSVTASPLDLSAHAGVRFALVNHVPALPREFIITISDGEETATLTCAGRGARALHRSHFDFRDFQNIERINVTEIRRIEVEFLPPRIRFRGEESLGGEGGASPPMPGPGGLALLALGLMHQSRRRTLRHS